MASISVDRSGLNGWVKTSLEDCLVPLKRIKLLELGHPGPNPGHCFYLGKLGNTASDLSKLFNIYL